MHWPSCHAPRETGVIPVTGIVPVVGHFHSMLEAARLAKTNKTNANTGDVGQRMRLAWKQACLIDQNAGVYVGSKVRRREIRLNMLYKKQKTKRQEENNSNLFVCLVDCFHFIFHPYYYFSFFCLFVSFYGL